MTMKAYFYGADGKEIASPFSGRTLNYGSAFIIRDGVSLKNTRYEIGVDMGKGAREHRVTAADFGGQAVLVKAWYPGTDGAGHAEWYYLIAPEIGDVEACDYRGTFPPERKFNWAMAVAQ